MQRVSMLSKPLPQQLEQYLFGLKDEARSKIVSTLYKM